MAQIVDMATAREFMKEALGKASAEDLAGICRDLARKSDLFRDTLTDEKCAGLSDEEALRVLRLIFSTRRKARQILQDNPVRDFRARLRQLLYGGSPLPDRLNSFIGSLKGVEENVACDLATELLHFAAPEKHWLWTRWIWDPRIRTGALPLVITEEFDLTGADAGQTYLKVGKAMAFVRHVGEAAEFEVFAGGPFGVDAYLCSVYVIYVYTVLRMRMTQEFNQVIPGLTEFSRRLLGIQGGGK